MPKLWMQLVATFQAAPVPILAGVVVLFCLSFAFALKVGNGRVSRQDVQRRALLAKALCHPEQVRSIWLVQRGDIYAQPWLCAQFADGAVHVLAVPDDSAMVFAQLEQHGIAFQAGGPKEGWAVRPEEWQA